MIIIIFINMEFQTLVDFLSASKVIAPEKETLGNVRFIELKINHKKSQRQAGKKTGSNVVPVRRGAQGDNPFPTRGDHI